jgi:L-fucose isomerase-like protein
MQKDERGDMTLRIGFVPIARPTFDVPLATAVAAEMRATLSAAGMQVIGPDALAMDAAAAQAASEMLAGQSLDLLLAFQASFADSSVVVNLAKAVDAPLFLWAVPEERTGGRLRLNSFCGINLAGHGLTRAGLKYEWVYAQPNDPAALQSLLTLARAGRVKRLLRSARIGRIGDHPVGFDPCSYDAAAIAARLGSQVVRKELAEVFAGVRTAAPDAVAGALGALSSRVAGLDALDQPALRGTIGAYLTLQRLAQAESLDGLAIRCWPEFFTELGCAACGAMSLLTDGLTPCSCEADVNGTITQLILQWLSGAQAFGTDVVGFDLEQDNAVVWHCGQAPLAMADPEFQPRSTIHSNRKLPLLMEFPLKPGRVTIARLTEAKGGFTLVVGAGEMLRAPLSYSGTSGVLRFDRPAAEVLATIMDEGLDHHIALTYGDHVAELLDLAKLLDLPVLRLA